MENDIINPQERKLNPWLSIWIYPRVTIRQVLKQENELMMYLIVSISGFGQVLATASAESYGDRYSMIFILGAAVLGGFVLGLIGLYISAGLIKWVGGWFGGKATYKEVEIALAWSNVPLVWILLLWIPEYLLFGKELFLSVTPRLDANIFLILLLLFFSVIEIAAVVWAFIIALHCIGEAMDLSAWIVLGAMIISWLLVGVPLIIIGVLITFLL